MTGAVFGQGVADEHPPIHAIGERWIAAYEGTRLEAEPPKRLVITFEDSEEKRVTGPSVATFLIEPHEDIVRLTVFRENLPNNDML